MKRSHLIERFSALGRLRRRYTLLLREMDGGASRQEIAQLVARDVIEPALALDDPERHQLLAEAELTRAWLFVESRGASPLDAADALLAMDQHQQRLPVEARPSNRILAVVRAMIPELRALGSVRTRADVISVLLRAADDLGAQDLRILDELGQIPELLSELWERQDLDGARNLLEAGRRRLFRPAGKQVRAELTRLATVARRTTVAVGLLDEGDTPEPELWLEIAEQVLVERRRDRRSIRLLVRMIEEVDGACVRLQEGLREFAAPESSEADPESLPAVAALLRAVAKRLSNETWPIVSLMAVECHRGHHPAVVASFVEALERGWRPAGPAAVLLSLSLRCLGFRVAARTMRDRSGVSPEDPARMLGDLIELVDSGQMDDTLAVRLGDALRRFPCSGPLLRLVHRLRARSQVAGGTSTGARHILEALLSRRPDDAELANELVGVALALNEPEMATDYIDVAESTGITRRTVTFRALLAERQSKERALEAFEAALAAPRHRESYRSERLGLVERLLSTAETRRRTGRGIEFLKALKDEAPCEFPDPMTGVAMRRRAASLARGLQDRAREAELLAPTVARRGAPTEDVMSFARACLASGRVEDAKATLTNLVKRRDVPPDAWLLMSLVSLRLGKTAEAQRPLLRGAEATGEARGNSLLALALWTYEVGEFDATLAHLDALAAEPLEAADQPIAQELRIRCLLRRGRADEAKCAAEAALAAAARPTHSLLRLLMQASLVSAEQCNSVDAWRDALRSVAHVRGERGPVEGSRPRIDVLLEIRRIVRRMDDGLPPEEVSDALERILAEVPPRSQARVPLTRARDKARERASMPTAAQLTLLLRDPDASLDVLALRSAQTLEEGGGAAERQWATLVRLRYAVGREIARDPVATGAFEDAIRSLPRFLDDVDRGAGQWEGIEEPRRRAATRAFRDYVVTSMRSLAVRWADDDPERASAYARLALMGSHPSDEAAAELADALLADVGPLSDLEQREIMRRRIDVLFGADPENRVGLHLLLRTEVEELRELLLEHDTSPLTGEQIELMDDVVLRATPAIGPLSDEAEGQSSERELAHLIGTWRWARSLVAVARGQSERATERDEAARWLRRAGDPDGLLAAAEGTEATMTVDAPLEERSATQFIDQFDREPEPLPEPVKTPATPREIIDSCLFAADEAALGGRGDEAEQRLNEAFAVARENREEDLVRMVIERMHAFRQDRDSGRRARMADAVRASLKRRRFRDALDRINGLASDPVLSAELLPCRVEALLGLHRADKALEVLESADAMGAQGVVFEGLAALFERVFLEESALRIETLAPAVEALLHGKPEGALMLLGSVSRDHRGDPAVCIVRARALAKVGMLADAQRSSREALANKALSPVARRCLDQLAADLLERSR